MTEAETYDALEALKLQANQLGIKFGPNIGVETLKEKIQQKLFPDAKAQLYKERKEYVDRNRALVRVSIVDFDPSDVGKQGLIYTFANQVLGKMRYYVPISGQAAKAWHLPRAFVNMLRDIKYTHKQSSNEKSNKVSTREMPKFQIDELEPLTQQQLNDLAAAQRGRLEDAESK